MVTCTSHFINFSYNSSKCTDKLVFKSVKGNVIKTARVCISLLFGALCLCGLM